MKYLIRLPLAMTVLGVLTFGTVACSVAPPAQMYQLQQPVADVSNPKNTATVLLGPVKIADYLQRESLLQRKADGSLAVSSEGRWAGSLENNIGQFLLRQVAAQLGSSRISLYPDRIGITAQAQAIVVISRLDSGVEQPAILEAQWRLLDEQGSLTDSRLVYLEETHNGELADQVRAQSELLGQLTQQLVSALQEVLPTQSAQQRAPRKVSAASSNEKKSTPQSDRLSIPVVEPEREQEVYRF